MKWIWLLALLVLGVHPSPAQQLNGFNLSEALVPVKDILRGGPPRDGIPSIDQPVFQTAAKYREFSNSVQVLGVYFQGIAKAYPINIMDWHEVVNDDFKGQAVTITYCPLCGSGIAFKADVKQGANKEFGVSGLLYNSDVLLYDRATHSLWSQIMGKAISGPLKGRKLEPINTQRLTLGAWKAQYPQTLIMTMQTGHQRNYSTTPYSNYDQQNSTYFPVTHSDNTFHKKEWVIGVEHNGVFKAYPIKKLAKLPDRRLVDQLGGETITLTWDKRTQHILIKDSHGREIVGLQMFWFAWAAFHPHTQVYK